MHMKQFLTKLLFKGKNKNKNGDKTMDNNNFQQGNVHGGNMRETNENSNNQHNQGFDRGYQTNNQNRNGNGFTQMNNQNRNGNGFTHMNNQGANGNGVNQMRNQGLNNNGVNQMHDQGANIYKAELPEIYSIYKQSYQKLESAIKQKFTKEKECYETKIRNLENELAEKKSQLKDYEITIESFEREAERNQGKVQIRNVMDKILMPLTDIINNIEDNDNLDELKRRSKIYVDRLFEVFNEVGITLRMDKRGDLIDDSDSCIDIHSVPTADQRENGRIVRVDKIGCSIRNERQQIPEIVLMYLFDPKKNPLSEKTSENAIAENTESVEPALIDENECEKTINENGQFEPRKKCGEEKRLKAQKSGEENKIMFLNDVKLLNEEKEGFTIFDAYKKISTGEDGQLSIPLAYRTQEMYVFSSDNKITDTPQKYKSEKLSYRIYIDDGKPWLRLKAFEAEKNCSINEVEIIPIEFENK